MTFETIISVLLFILAVFFLVDRANSKRERDSQNEEISDLKKNVSNLSTAVPKAIQANNESQNKRIDKNYATLSKELLRLSQALQEVINDNDELKKENQELRERLAFYTEIDAESGEINNTEDSKRAEKLLESIDLDKEFAALGSSMPTDDGMPYPGVRKRP